MHVSVLGLRQYRVRYPRRALRQLATGRYQLWQQGFAHCPGAPPTRISALAGLELIGAQMFGAAHFASVAGAVV